MKKFTKFIALFLAILSLCAVAMPAMAATTMYVNCTPDLNFRKGPGKSYDLIDRIPYREAVVQYSTVIGTDGKQWSYITYDGKNGYVMSEYLSSTLPGLTKYHPETISEAFGNNLLKKGASNYFVKNLQLALSIDCWGGMTAADIDGVFGSKTEKAVKEFQYFLFESDASIKVDGIVGPQTKEALWNEYKFELQKDGYMN